VDGGFPQAGTFLWRRTLVERLFSLFASNRWSNSQASYDGCCLRHNKCQRLLKKPVGQRLHTDRTYWTLHRLTSDVSPKRETIRGEVKTVKRRASHRRFIAAFANG
jgi:hypothetical protein